ncbi:hypothetical protein MMC17_000411 [Xylographa soralifera]|nr:hypothetical protein [Xylographa soralifera]
MENTIRDFSGGNETPLAIISNAIEAPPPATNQPAGTDCVAIAPEVLMFLSEFFLAMQISPAEFTEDEERIFRHSQAVLLRTLIEAHRVARHIGSYTRAFIRLAQAIEQRSLELQTRELLSAQAELDRTHDALAMVNRIQTVAYRLAGERLGGRLRRAGRAVRSVFRPSRRDFEGVGGDEEVHSE